MFRLMMLALLYFILCGRVTADSVTITQVNYANNTVKPKGSFQAMALTAIYVQYKVGNMWVTVQQPTAAYNVLNKTWEFMQPVPIPAGQQTIRVLMVIVPNTNEVASDPVTVGP